MNNPTIYKVIWCRATEKPRRVAGFCFPASQRKAKNKTYPLRALRLCGELKETIRRPYRGIIKLPPLGLLGVVVNSRGRPRIKTYAFLPPGWVRAQSFFIGFYRPQEKGFVGALLAAPKQCGPILSLRQERFLESYSSTCARHGGGLGGFGTSGVQKRWSEGIPTLPASQFQESGRARLGVFRVDIKPLVRP